MNVTRDIPAVLQGKSHQQSPELASASVSQGCLIEMPLRHDERHPEAWMVDARTRSAREGVAELAFRKQ